MLRPGALVDGGRATEVLFAAVCLLAACSGETRIRLVPLDPVGTGCGRPADATTLRVVALGDFASRTRTIGFGDALDIDNLPGDTRQLTVEVLGAGGVVLAIGKTATFELSALGDGDEIPVVMAPPGGMCPVSALGVAQMAPTLIRAGDGVLLLGGRDARGPVIDAEWYDPRTGRFSEVPVPPPWAGSFGFAGASAVALPDGTVAVIGGAVGAYAIFDPATRAFRDPPGALLEDRAFHAAVALDDGRVLLAGGCAVGADGLPDCQPADADRQASILTLASGRLVRSAVVAGTVAGATAVLEASGDDLAGPPRVLLAGGTDADDRPVAFAQRFAIEDVASERVDGVPGVPVALDGGAVLVALSPTGTPLGSAAVIPPGRAARVVGATTPRRDATLTLLEDGSVLALGGAGASRYFPEAGRWQTDAIPGEGPDELVGHGAVRLDDGSVLIAGGRDGDDPVASAYVLRPSLVGPFAGALVAAAVQAGEDFDENAVSPLDPARLTREATWRLTADGPGLRSWVVVTGPRMTDGVLQASVLATGGGAAVLVGFVDPAHVDVVELPADAPPRLVRHRPGRVETLCTGDALVPITAATITVSRAGDRVTAQVVPGELGRGDVLSCTTPEPARGLWGLAPLGDGAELGIALVQIHR